jgi:hypothetical protein
MQFNTGYQRLVVIDDSLRNRNSIDYVTLLAKLIQT